MGASLLIPSLLLNCTLSNLAKSPNQCCKLSLRGVDDMIFAFTSKEYKISRVLSKRYVHDQGDRSIHVCGESSFS